MKTYGKNKRRSVTFANNAWIHSGDPTPDVIYQSGSGKIVNSQLAEGAARVGAWRLSFVLPADFRSFQADAIEIDVRKDADVTFMNLLLQGNDGSHDPAIDSVSIEPSEIDLWEVKKFTPTGVYHPGDTITFTQRSSLPENSTVLINAFKIKYRPK